MKDETERIPFNSRVCVAFRNEHVHEHEHVLSFSSFPFS
jgi:hypothetical protein